VRGTFIRRPSPAMAVALLALFVALGGSSYAALRIGTRQIKNNSIRSVDIKNRTVRGRDIHRRTVRRANVARRTLFGINLARDRVTGAEVDESSLGTVRSASNANTLRGLGPSAFVPAGKVLSSGSGKRLAPGETATLLDNNGLKLREKCQDDGGGNLTVKVFFESSEAGSRGGSVLGSTGAFGPGASTEASAGGSGTSSFYTPGTPFGAATPSGKTLDGVFSLGRNVLGTSNGCFGSAMSVG
jgi:hypothetical protein